MIDQILFADHARHDRLHLCTARPDFAACEDFEGLTTCSLSPELLVNRSTPEVAGSTIARLARIRRAAVAALWLFAIPASARKSEDRET